MKRIYAAITGISGQKRTMMLYIIAALLLAYLIFLTGCSENPLLRVFGTSFDVGVGRL